jgi:hypothetical protein
MAAETLAPSVLMRAMRTRTKYNMAVIQVGQSAAAGGHKAMDVARCKLLSNSGAACLAKNSSRL